MTDRLPPDVEDAVHAFDRALHSPGQGADAMSDLFAALGAVAQEVSDEQKAARERLREALRNDPVTRINRSAGAHRGWETRRARKEHERLLEEAEKPLRMHPACDEMNHDSVGREIFCQLDPDHEGDHDDDSGTTWEQEDDG